MISNPKHKQKVWFYRGQKVYLGTITNLSPDIITVRYKDNGKHCQISLTADQLYCSWSEGKTACEWDPEAQNIPDTYTADFLRITEKPELLEFLFENLKPEVKHTAAVMIYNIFGSKFEA